MGGYFPCFGSSNKNGVNSVKEVAKKESLKEGLVAQSHHVNRVSSAKSKSRGGIDLKKEQPVPKDGSTAHIAAQTFTFVSLLLPQRTLDPNACSVRVGSAMFTRVVWIQDRGILVPCTFMFVNGLYCSVTRFNSIKSCSKLSWHLTMKTVSIEQEHLPVAQCSPSSHQLYPFNEIAENTRIQIELFGSCSKRVQIPYSLA